MWAEFPYQNEWVDSVSMGIFAGVNSTGFRPDGSFLHTRYYAGLQNHRDVRFKHTFSKMNKGIDFFMHGQDVSEEKWKYFLEILKKLRENQVQVVLFYPPLSTAVYQKMQSMKKSYAYYWKLKDRLRSLNAEFYDFSNIQRLGSNDCECTDGFHGGVVLHNRMLLDIVKQNPKTVLAPFLRSQALKQEIKRYAGLTAPPDFMTKAHFDEVDYLELGCQKPRSSG